MSVLLGKAGMVCFVRDTHWNMKCITSHSCKFNALFLMS